MKFNMKQFILTQDVIPSPHEYYKYVLSLSTMTMHICLRVWKHYGC